MGDDSREPSKLWYSPRGARNLAIFSVFWLGEAFLTLMFLKWVFHLGVLLYLLVIPWALLGAIIIARPNWLMRMDRAAEDKAKRDMERLDKWTPPGVP
jgi:hypothetical protein